MGKRLRQRDKPLVSLSPVYGLIYSIAAFVWWGFLPLYYKQLTNIDTFDLVAHRTIWTFITLTAMLVLLRKAKFLIIIKNDPQKVSILICTTFLLGFGWLVFVWAIVSNQVLQMSLGFFMNPLVNVALGALFLKERFSQNQAVAIGFLTAGLIVMVAQSGTFPWISIALALTFGTYALLHKQLEGDPFASLTFETGILAPFAVIYLMLGTYGSSEMPLEQYEYNTWVLLIFLGAMTAIPFLLFIYGLQHARLSTVGLMHYLTPTIQLLLAVLLWEEPFTGVHMISFGLVWLGIAIYLMSAFGVLSNRRA